MSYHIHKASYYRKCRTYSKVKKYISCTFQREPQLLIYPHPSQHKYTHKHRFTHTCTRLNIVFWIFFFTYQYTLSIFPCGEIIFCNLLIIICNSVLLYTGVGISRLTVINMEKGMQVMIITIALTVSYIFTTINLLFPIPTVILLLSLLFHICITSNFSLL